MTKNVFFISLFSFLLLFSCDDSYKLKLEVPHKTTLNSDLTITLNEENNKPLDKVQFFINGKEVSASENSLQFNTSDYGLGKHQVSALVFYPGKTKKVNNYFEVFAENKPVIYGYEIVNTYPHDTKAYTQGLEYYNGFLYETTGRRGQSFLRKVDIKTGDVVQQIALDNKYFGEGMTIVNNKIYFLTYFTV